MSDIAIIQKATLYEMADAIIDTTERTESFKVSDMPRLIREDVYNKGYADGEANGTSEPILYGTYLLRDHPSITRPSEYVDYSLEGLESYGFYIVASEITYGNIHSIQFGDEGFIYIHFDRNSYLAYEGYWRYYDGEDEMFVDVPDERFRIIDIKAPITVSKDIYDMFMRCVDNDQENTSFDIGYDVGFEDGEIAQSDEFWDNYQNKGKRTFYGDAFNGAGFEYIRPKYKVVPTDVISGCRTLRYCTNLKKIESQYFDFSQLPFGTYEGAGMYYTFSGCSVLEEIEDIGLSPSYSYSYTFAWNGKLKTIAKITVDANTRFSGAFTNCIALENLTIEGTIGQNGLDLRWSTKLSRASIESILSHLSTTTSGLSITLSKMAVDKAFETSKGANDGYNSEDFRDLVQLHNNWTINLV